MSYGFFLLVWLVGCILLGLWATRFFFGYQYPVPVPPFVAAMPSRISAFAAQTVAVATPAATPETKVKLPGLASCNQELREILQAESVHFATGSAELSVQGAQTVKRLVQAMKLCNDVAIEITGHTDSTGSETRNLHLSAQRAEAVADEMLVLGVLPTRLRVSGVGSSHPVASNQTAEGRLSNRRIEVRLYVEE